MNQNDELQPLPALDLRLSWRAAGPCDLDAWAGLIARTAAVEQPVWFERRADLEQILESKNNPAAANTILGFDPEGVARAYGRITKNRDGDKAIGFGCVHPEWQGSGIGTGLLGWMEQRTRDRFAEDAGTTGNAEDPGGARAAVPRPRLRLYMEQQHQHQAALYADSGYGVVRYFNEMHRPLNQTMPEAVLDPGLELVTFGPALHEPVRLAHNAAFRDHWGSEPRDEEAWGFVVNDPQARPDLSGVVLERSTGTVAGYQLATHDAEAALAPGIPRGVHGAPRSPSGIQGTGHSAGAAGRCHAPLRRRGDGRGLTGRRFRKPDRSPRALRQDGLCGGQPEHGVGQGTPAGSAVGGCFRDRPC